MKKICICILILFCGFLAFAETEYFSYTGKGSNQLKISGFHVKKNGMGNLDFLRNMIAVLDFRAEIENEMGQEFQSFLKELKDIYKKHYLQDFSYNTDKQNDLENKGKGLISAKKWRIVGESNRSQIYYRLDNNPDRARGLTTNREYIIID